MASPGPETKLVAKIREAIRKRYPEAFVVKLHGGSYSQAGLPDLLIIVDGLAIMFEVKAQRPGESEAALMGRVTPLQHQTLQQIRKANGVADVVWDVEQTLALIATHIPVRGNDDASRDQRLYALADAEDKLRKRNEELEAQVCELRAEIKRLESK